MSVAQSVPATTLHEAIARLGVTHVLSVPDTHQKTLVALLTADTSWRLLTLSTEEEAIAVNAGLWMGGAEPLVVIQNVGVFAAMNALRGMAMDAKVPTCMLVGQFGRNVDVAVEDDRSSAVRLIEPVLQTMGVRFYRMDSENDVGVLGKAWRESREERKPIIVLIGAPTS